MKLEHQFIDTETTFLHRIVPQGTAIETKSKAGPWTGYTSPACFHTTKGVFVGVTDFYKNSPEFPDPGVIYWVRPAPAEGI